MKKVKGLWPFIFITIIVLLFFLPVFKGNIPFPGDLLANQNPYKTQSFLGYAPGGYPNKAQGPDVITEIYPWRFFSVESLKQGFIPFWNPHNFSGNPQMADFQTGIFYPLNFLYLLLPFNISWTIIIMLQPLFAGFFMYLFLKKGIGIKDFPSVIGAISFGFSSYMSVWIEYGNIGSTLLWLPLALLLTKYYFKRSSLTNFLGLAGVLSISILAGYIQGVFYIYVLCFIYYNYLTFCAKGEFKKHKKNFLFLVSLALPFLLTSFQVLPTLEIFSQSTRGAYTLSQIQTNLAPVFTWVTILFSDFFGNPATRNYWIDGTYIERVMYSGSLILFFMFYAVFSKVEYVEKKLFVVIGIISLIIATNLPFIKYFYLIPISVISTTIPTRELSIFIFCVIVVGAMGLEYFLENKEFKKIFAYLYLGIIIFFWGVVLIGIKLFPSISQNLKISEHNLIIPTVIIILTIAAVLIKNINKKVSLILITVLVVFDLLYFFNKITPFSPQELMYPSTPVVNYLQKNAGLYRFWGYGLGYIPSNFQSVDKTYSPEGNDPLHISLYGQLLSSSRNGKLPDTLPRPDANIAPGYGVGDLKNNFYRKRMLDLLGVKYILNEEDMLDIWRAEDLATFPKESYSLVSRIYPWQIYENKNVVPRFFITGNFVLSKNKSETLSLIYNKNINLKTTVVLENHPEMSIDTKVSGNATLISYKPNEVIFKTNTSGNSLLFLSDNYYPEWSVKVDGAFSKILVADYAFRAVEIPKGSHTVEFFYDPKSFKLGLGISLLTLLLILVSSIYVIINPARFKKNELIKK